ncbi:flagellar export chaperone FliS [bacterium]|nr:flagellar export chaperone FliS [bacterium]
MTLHAYQSIRKAALVEGATPHQLIKLLYDGSLSNIAIARQHLARGNRGGMHHHIDKTIAIVQELQGSLKDYETNELAGNLFELYTYIVKTLISSDKHMDDEGFGVCAHLLDVLSDAWKSIAPENIEAA